MSKNRIVISEFDNIATIFQNDLAVEFIIQRGDMLLGDVFLAEVENILPSIDAAFVNVGSDKMGFLHSSDVPGKGDLKKRLKPKQQLVVQVMKEPTGHKGPRVTTNISLPGRFLVMMPESKGISISRRIVEQKERSRLKSVVNLLKPQGIGVIIRTEAEKQSDQDIQEDLETLIERWQNIVSMADTAKPPTLLYRDQDLLYRVIREAVNEDIQEIVVDTQFGQTRAQQLLQNWNIDKKIKVSLYNGNHSILVGTGVDREIRQALNTKVPLPSGGYLYIQPTEALTVVDVNSGKFVSLDSQAETIKQTNLEACREIARQLRLRNIGGMIIVDFIDMESRAHQLKIMEAFENEMTADKAKPQIGQLSDLGLVEMTRHRQGQSLGEIFTSRCKSCHGNGNVVDDFHWTPPNIHGDPRSGGYPTGARKHPTKGTKHQRVAKLKNKKDQPYAIPGQTLEQPHRRKSRNATAQNKVDVAKNLFENGEQSNEKIRSKNHKTIAEHLREGIEKELGVHFSIIAKMSHTPPEANNILARINPKANDVITLVELLENSPHDSKYSNNLDDDDVDFDDDQFDDEQDLGNDGDDNDEGKPVAITADGEAVSDDDSDDDKKNKSSSGARRRGRPRKSSGSGRSRGRRSSRSKK